MSFTKLFSSITASTIWNEPDRTRIVWITMLAMADRDGHVAASIPGLAVLARVPVESVITAIESFLLPDQWSRTKDHDGRRIEAVDGGWNLLNYDKYRAQMNADEQREKTAARVKRWRERKGDVTPGNACNVTVTHVTPGNDIADAEAEADAEEIQKQIHVASSAKNAPSASLPDGKPRKRKSRKEYPEGFEEFWEASWRRGSKAKSATAFKRAVASFGFERLLGATKNFATAYSASEARFRPNVVTWLNGKCYEQPVEDFLGGSAPKAAPGDEYVDWLANLPAN